MVIGFLLALPPRPRAGDGPPRAAALARAQLCTLIRGTPLLLQLWLLYFGLARSSRNSPEIRETWAWAYLRQAWPYGFLALTISFAAYQAR